MKKRFLNCTVATLMFVAAIPFVASKANGGKSETKVFAQSDVHDHTGYNSWGAVDSEKTSLPSREGNYYLTSDISLNGFWTVPQGTTNLCLNGHVIKNDTTSHVISIGENCTLNLYDCGSTVHNGYVDGNGLWHLDEEGTHSLGSSETSKAINGGIITGGNAQEGGGIHNEGTFIMHGGNIAGCKCTGADETTENIYYRGGGVANYKNFTMKGGTITGCTAYANGGGVYNAGTFLLEGGSIEECSVLSDKGGKGLGGGFYNYSGGTATLSGGEIKNNKASRHGGGIQNCGTNANLGVAILNITGTSILNNNAESGGGGINSDGTIHMSNGLISNNRANDASKGGGGIRYNGGDTASIIFGGSAKVIDNKAGNFRNNVFLCQYKLLTLGTKTNSDDGNEVDKPTNEMCVGLSADSYNNGRFGKNCIEGDEKYFFADDYLYSLVIEVERGFLQSTRKTVGHLLPEDFPVKSGDEIPENAWINEQGAKLYLNEKVFYINDNLFIPDFSSETPILHDSSSNKYNYNSTRSSITLRMDFNLANEYSQTVESITTSAVGTELGVLIGTFKPLQVVEKPAPDTTNFVYNGMSQTYNIPANDAYNASNITKKEVGIYTVTVALANVYQYQWADGTTNPLEFSFVINKKAEDVKIKENGTEIDPSNAKVSIIAAENGIDPNAIFIVEVVAMEQAEEVEQSKQALENNSKIAKNEKIFGIYDAKLLVDGAEVQPNGMITIKMLVPEEIRESNFKLYHIHNGTEVLTIEYSQLDEGGFITFTTDKLSQFAFVSEVASEKSGLGAGAIVGIILGILFLLLLVVYVLGYFFLYRKGKLDDKKIKIIYKFLPRGDEKLKEEKNNRF